MKQEHLIRCLLNMSQAMQQHRQELTELDTAIGDGDHGINMARAFLEVEKKLPELQNKSLFELVRTVGMTLAFKVGGASGPLYGTCFMDAAQALKDQEELNLPLFLAMLELGILGIQKRGHAVQGEKTMLDTLIPAKEALAKHLNETDALQQMLTAAEKGRDATVDMLATKGRASYLGERSIGHQDPGAGSAYYLLKAIIDTVQEG